MSLGEVPCVYILFYFTVTGVGGTQEQYDKKTMGFLNQAFLTPQKTNSQKYSLLFSLQGKLVGDKRLRFVTGAGTR